MRLPRMTTRRWMVVVAMVAVLIWGGLSTWRWYHFRELARGRLEAAESMAFLESMHQRRIELFQKQLTEYEGHIVQLLRQDYVLMSDLERDSWRVSIDLYKAQIQELKHESEDSQRDIERFAALRRKYEASARKYQEAAVHPWAMAPHIP